ncbi:hydroxymethylglutaryl-CoA lyase [Marivirga sp. S37H4]|uniref:Hydroxymethylglutaryl-CoA lyase n=1 Tax=Marivirga aurantiaca TaxID=2802615 RepID=A0A934X2R2_9BACT|nr:hydroxymethylglutaryl-CoA lyase [Marivirga aurantiaca]MBK6267290.1 hydroxymethylglutaryl-CoA lyase [Marivirga aurantiaca]
MKNKSSQRLKIIECPRDAMQGLHEFIPTEQKIAYLNQLLKVGFDTIDAGSFVSPKAIPQLRDTAEVFDKIDLSKTKSKLLAIIANQRGAESAVAFPQIDYLGYPLSLSETFQQRNTNRSIATAMEDLKAIQSLCVKHEKTLVVYLSMGFGNPYGDPYNASYIDDFVQKLKEIDVSIISLADTIGVSNPKNISWIFNEIIPKYPQIEFGAHLHSTPETIREKVEAAFEAGCLRFDGAIKGYGGCPMAEDDLVGNMATEQMVAYFEEVGQDLSLDQSAFREAQNMAGRIFPL